MNKRIMMCLVVCLGMSVLFATTPVGPSTDAAYLPVGEPFYPVSSRAMGMGGAGIAVASSFGNHYLNPASYADGRFSITIPAATVTLYNLHNMLSTGMIEDVFNAGGNDAALINAADKYLGIISTQGYNEIATVDAALGFSTHGFSLMFRAQEQLHTYSPYGQPSTTNIIGQVDLTGSLGYAYRWVMPNDQYSIDFGATLRFDWRVYTSRIDAQTVLPLLLGANSGNSNLVDSLLNGTQLMSGFAVPLDMAVNFNMPYGFTLSVVGRNLNGMFYMWAYPAISTWGHESFGNAWTSDGSYTAGETTAFKIYSKPTLDFGFGWDPSFGKVGYFFKPVVALDFVDIVGFFEDAPTWSSLLEHINAGLELKLLSCLDLRVGVNQGYLSLGATLDMYVMQVEASYYWQEFGAQLGDKPVDALSVRVSLGYDR